MLQKLTIRNYAIIDELEINFSGKLNIITGETGAGKSIIVGALGLILGERADSSVLQNKEKKSVIEGQFFVANKTEVFNFLDANEIEKSDELLIRREVSNAGKSRAFINDTPVTLTQLQQLGAALVDLHQQFDTLKLGETNFQRQVLDAIANNASQLKEYRQVFKQWQSIKKEYAQLKEQKQQFDKEADYHRFQLTELEEASFKENELEEAEETIKLLNDAENIKAALNKAYYDLEDGEHPMLQQLKQIINQLATYAPQLLALNVTVKRLESIQVELKDIAGDLEQINDKVSHDPASIELLNERLSLGYKLQKKHGVKSTAELLIIQADLQQKLQAVLETEEAINAKEKEEKKLFAIAQKQANLLFELRQKHIKPFEEKVNSLLKQIGMPNAGLLVDLQRQDLGINGADNIEFLFNANCSAQDVSKSEKAQPIYKVASGGELSRLMLCIKSLVAGAIDLPTMIFDEIDSGISGEAARQVGNILKELALKRQIICITHQPQIAGRAHEHYFVYKEIVNDVIKTNIRILSVDERIIAIAKMLSGEKPTAAAIENAREMIGN